PARRPSPLPPPPPPSLFPYTTLFRSRQLRLQLQRLTRQHCGLLAILHRPVARRERLRVRLPVLRVGAHHGLVLLGDLTGQMIQFPPDRSEVHDHRLHIEVLHLPLSDQRVLELGEFVAHPQSSLMMSASVSSPFPSLVSSRGHIA